MASSFEARGAGYCRSTTRAFFEPREFLLCSFFIGAGGSTAGATDSVLLGARPASAMLPVIAQISGTLLFPAIGFADTLTLSASATAPAGVGLQSARRAQSGTLTVYEYITISSPLTVTLPAIPAMTLTFGPSTPLAGKSVCYGISNLDARGGQISFDTRGPGAISDHTVTFAQVPTTLTLEAGHKYTFVVYATTSTQLLYVTNAAANSITAYALPAHGNVAPVRTISGAATGLSHPSALALDVSGNIIVVNAASVEIFPEGANGNTRPSATLAISGGSSSVALDPVNGDIFISRPNNEAGLVDVFSRSGALQRSISQIPNSLWGFLVQGLAVDKTDRLFVGIELAGRDVCNPGYLCSPRTLTGRRLHSRLSGAVPAPTSPQSPKPNVPTKWLKSAGRSRIRTQNNSLRTQTVPSPPCASWTI